MNTYIVIIIVIFFFAIYLKRNNQLTEFFDNFPYQSDTKVENITIDKHQFKISKLRDDPIMLELYPFLSPRECQHLINLAKDNFIRSPVVNKEGIDKNRTSYSYFIPKSNDNIVKNVETRICQFCNVDPCMLEQLQVVRYLPKQQFDYHYAWFDPNLKEGRKEMERGGQRRYTIFIYLNNLTDKEYKLNEKLNTNSGKTCFKKYNLCISPKEGLGVFWKNIVNNKLNYDSLHAGIAPQYSTKYGLNVWIREACQ